MTDQETLDLIKAAALQASRNACRGQCAPYFRQPGTPPAGWHEKARRLARRYGKAFSSEYLPVDGLDGITTGPLERPANRVIVSDELSPAREFAAAVHELTHMVLRHPCETQQERMQEHMYRKYMQQGAPFRENLQAEMACELSSSAVQARAGLDPFSGPSMCYLQQRMLRGGAPESSTLYAALMAAKEIGAALLW